MDIYDVLEYLTIGTLGLMVFLIFILLIVVAVSNTKKKLEPDCKKGFSRFFISFLVFSMFSTFFDFAFRLTIRILIESISNLEMSYFEYRDIYNIIWGIGYGLAFLNQFIAFILLFISMEINLFNKKSKMKFGILSIILLCGAFLYIIIEIIFYYVFGYQEYWISDYLVLHAPSLTYLITQLVVGILTNFNYLIIGIIALVLLVKTAKENELLSKYTKSLSAGVILLFVICPLLYQLEGIINFLDMMSLINGNLDFPDIYYWFNISIFFLSSLLFIIGIIILSIGAVKTMNVPLTFSREKGAKGIPRKDTNSCSECGSTIPPLAEFCTNCGHHT